MNANHPSHYVGQNIDNVDQLSSITLLGLAVLGAIATLLANWVVIG
ncbi:hypothetical protein [Methylobacterium brachythecii]|nr:hypothetical protein [Methylobacterium brachythecii]MBB3904203.1 hypothetical protein [Methylobacterium brachythecii]